MNILQAYLSDLHHAHATGVKETSFYPALSALFNAVGKTLKPPVRCVIHPQSQGAGLPDGGFFTPDQYASAEADKPLPSNLKPSRGVLEVKGAGVSIADLAASAQMDKYWQAYGQVLATNLREFALVGKNPAGQKTVLERFSLAGSESALWQMAAHPAQASDALAAQFAEYLQRVLLHAAPLATPQDVARLLASYAREARSRVEHAGAPALAPVRAALEGTLGLTLKDEHGVHFFQSTLVQTLFYGLFSAWVLWNRSPQAQPPGAQFSWQSAAYYLHVPMIQTLFEEVSKASTLGALGLVEVLDWTGAALNRVDRAAFFATFDQGDAVQYFYEPFLEAFDPQLRRDLGVWYTPPEIVRYMVARVDQTLRDDLNLPLGLADPNVYVLDPCCGTGAYLTETLRVIRATLEDNGAGALAAQQLKDAATKRIYGFELLPAPFVVAHLQLGLLLQNAGAPLAATAPGVPGGERAGVYLTNALTGWEPPSEQAKAQLQQLDLNFPNFKREYDAAEQIKQSHKILVVLGNPPYNSFAGIGIAEEKALSEAYRTTQNAPKPQGQGLNDLYVRFFRMAERCITEGAGRGLVCFISNYSWLDGLSHTGMRERYLQAFDDIQIDCLNGDKYKTGKQTPEGLPDPSVFSTDFNREGIQVGTAIALLVRKAAHKGVDTVQFRQWWGRAKRQNLLASLQPNVDAPYAPLTPPLALGLPFVPMQTNDAYQEWPLLPDLFPVSFPGVKTSRDDVVVDIDRDRLEHRMKQYFDPAISHDQMRQIAPGVMESGARFDAVAVREYLVKRGYKPESIVRYCYRPFDVRWLYWEPETKLLDEKRSEYVSQVVAGNVWLGATQQNRKDFDPPIATELLSSLHIIERGVNLFPLWIKPNTAATLFSSDTSTATDPQPNLSAQAIAYLQALTNPAAAGGMKPPSPAQVSCGRDPSETESQPERQNPRPQDASCGDGGFIPPAHEPAIENGDCIPPAHGPDRTESLFYHALAILHAPAYREENAGALRQDWPRIPLPNSCDVLEQSADLGRQVAALLDTETPVPGVTEAPLRPELKLIGVPARMDGGQINPNAGDLRVSAGWGSAGQGGVTMPGKGKTVARPFTDAEAAALGDAAERLGPDTRDVYLNANVFWKNIPASVWNHTIGGYQVIKKWLSYREHPLLRRDLTLAEVQAVTAMARRLAALRLLEPELDANYQSVTASSHPWPPPAG